MIGESRVSPNTRRILRTVDHGTLWLARHWLGLFLAGYGAWVLLPFLSPVLMQAGATGAGDALYFVYSFFCHQLPERSLFFFGPKPMYSLAEIGRVWSTENAMVLRQFVGNPEMGWKMAWSDRMISTYGGVWVGGLLYALLRRRSPRLSLVAWLVLGILPLGLDGASHMLNDVLAGTTGLGFRDTNAWLAALTGYALPASFYMGDALGSFNSWMRWITGLLFGLTTVFAVFPLVEPAMQDMARDATRQLERLEAYE